jgi:hypothetical protein
MPSNTDIRTIANNLDTPVTVINGENKDMIFSIPSKGGWNGNLLVPWVKDQSEMSKCITLSVNGRKFAYLFQNNNYNPERIDWSPNGQFGGSYEVQGDNYSGGRKTLAITGEASQNGLRMETGSK